MEDEFLIRTCAAQMIQEAGYRAVEAADADEALAILEGRSDIRVVFTDIDMPGSLDGLKLAQAVRHRWPPVRIVATSEDHVSIGDMPTGSVFLAKPYNEPTLLWALRALTAA